MVIMPPGEAFFNSARLVMRSNNNNYCYSNNSIYLNTIKHSAKLMWSYTNNKLYLLTNHNKTNIRILRIYKNKNSTQYIIIIYVAESAAPISSRFFCPRPPLLLSNQNRHATQATSTPAPAARVMRRLLGTSQSETGNGL